MQKSLNSKQNQVFLKLLRQIREEAGLRQQDVAESLGLHQSFVSKYESGERRIDLIELEQICDACGVELAVFVKRFQSD